MAAEIASHNSTKDKTVTLVSSSDRLLASQPEQMGKAALRSLKRMKVKVCCCNPSMPEIVDACKVMITADLSFPNAHNLCFAVALDTRAAALTDSYYRLCCNSFDSSASSTNCRMLFAGHIG